MLNVFGAGAEQHTWCQAEGMSGPDDERVGGIARMAYNALILG